MIFLGDYCFILCCFLTIQDKDDDTLKKLLKENEERPVRVLVYSSKTLSVREVTLTPTNRWGGQGLLGVSIRFCSFEGANENVWHVLVRINKQPLITKDDKYHNLLLAWWAAHFQFHFAPILFPILGVKMYTNIVTIKVVEMVYAHFAGSAFYLCFF